MEVSSFTNFTLFWFSIVMHYFFISWIGMDVIFLAASYTAAWRIMFLDDCCIPFTWRTTIWSSVLATCNSIGTIFWRDILFIYSALAPEDTWMGAAHAWVFVIKSVGLRGSSFFFTKLSLMMFPADILKAYYDSTNMEFMWRGGNFVIQYFIIHALFATL